MSGKREKLITLDESFNSQQKHMIQDLSIKLIRLVTIFAVMTIILTIGELYRPNRAHADVYQTMRSQAASLFDFLNSSSTAPKRLLIINGHRMTVEFSQSDRQPSELINKVQTYTEADYEKHFKQSRLLDSEKKILAPLYRPFRFNEGNRIIYGRLFAGDARDGFKLMQQLSRGEPLENNAQGGFIVIANRPSQHVKTDVWTIQFEAAMNPLKLLGQHNADVEGQNPLSINRYPGSHRTLMLSEYTDFSEGHAIGFEGAGSVSSHIQHYLREFEAAGYRLANKTGLQLTSQKPQVLHFNGDGREIALFVSQAEYGSNRVFDLIQVRRTG